MQTRRAHIVQRMASTNTIGEYLRARRQLVRPEQAGLPDLGMRRRTPGLRREEVAMLAGVSADYYIRLEQGRDHHPSAQVLDALARAPQLDDDATAHLHSLASPEPQRRRRAPTRPERVPAGILQLLDTWTDTPAYVYGRYMDVLAANPLARALSPFNEPGTISCERSSSIPAPTTCSRTGTRRRSPPSPVCARWSDPTPMTHASTSSSANCR